MLPSRTSCALILAVLICGSRPAESQQEKWNSLTDEQFVAMVESIRGHGRHRPESLLGTPVRGKCGLSVSAESIRRRATLVPALAQRLDHAMQPPAMQTYIVSASGRFRVHYDLTGPHTPALIANGARVPNTATQYAQAVADIYDHTYEVEVSARGFKAPPFASGQSWYDVYLRAFTPGFYGWTRTLAQIPASTLYPCYTTFIEMDNDYLGYLSEGIAGAQVTAAHEFHHMIEIGGYGFFSWDEFFHEMTATYFEDVVYDDVNDYYHRYLPDFFRTPNTSLYAWDGYETILWLKMLDKRYRPEIVLEFWERAMIENPLVAMESVLKSSTYQTDLSQEHCRFARWNWCTGPRWKSAPEDERYDEGASYPMMRIGNSVQLLSTSARIDGDVQPLATEYSCVWHGADTAAFAVCNVDVGSGFLKSTARTLYSIDVRSTSFRNYTKLPSGWSYLFTSDASGDVCHSVFADIPVENHASAPFPNPYDPRVDGLVRIPVDAGSPHARAGLYIHTLSGSLIWSQDGVDIRKDAQLGRFITWDGTALDGTHTQSGVYIYTLQLGSDVTTGKIAVVRKQ